MEPILPEEVLVAWERSRNHGLTETKESRALEQLMNFLRQEDKGEEMVNLARTGFASHQSSRRKELHSDQVKQYESSTTASALVSLQTPGKRIHSCIFCDKSHPSARPLTKEVRTITGGRIQSTPPHTLLYQEREPAYLSGDFSISQICRVPR
ncbi:hypothetical protein AVEN_96833-1 [Araneus ventricosus]|uniref:Uncharacterized protein n=1 Tax=Araneus ventricosus TaxID=182803 RepID=A0A4Y2UQI0_ARAVE|nr:hypothetical protein AVEN_96833-1 [Araneus ventricosus]